MARSWIPVGEESVYESDRYRYVFGFYNHARWGNGCYRISKYLKENGYFIGHFVIVPSDVKAMDSIIQRWKEGLTTLP